MITLKDLKEKQTQAEKSFTRLAMQNGFTGYWDALRRESEWTNEMKAAWATNSQSIHAIYDAKGVTGMLETRH